MDKSTIKYPVLILVLVIGVLIGIQLTSFYKDRDLNENIKKFNDILTYTKEFYIEEVESKQLIENAIAGMFNELDPHTVYISADQQELAEEEFRGNFEGIGIEFQVIKDTITVVSPISGGPSEALGILAGDRIIKIDGKYCIGYSNTDVIKNLRGTKGTEVNITIYRPTINRIMEFSITRDKIPIYSVDASFMYDDETGYISLNRFGEQSPSELLKALNELGNHGAAKIVLDLRNNPGGLLESATEIADIFLSGEKLIVYTKGRRSEFNEEFVSEKEYPYESKPLIILVNAGSASASEIVAGAIQDWDRGLIVGETTFGKGLVQRPFILADNSAIRLTVSKYFTPSGRAIQRDYSNGNREDYYLEAYQRDNEKLNNPDSSKVDSIDVKYKTAGGRIVYGGGGITPDHIMSVDKLSDYSVELNRANVYYQFIRSYLDKNSAHIKSRYRDNLKNYLSEFDFTDTELKEFTNYGKLQGVPFVEKDFVQDKNYIKTRLKAFIAREYWKNNGWYSVLLREDNQFNEAIKYFNEAKSLAKL